MKALIETIPVYSRVRNLSALVIDPEINAASTPVLLFLHGKGEAGSSLNEVPLVCVHQTPPFQAMLGRLREVEIIAPQAPPLPSRDEWNWRDYVEGLAEFLRGDRFANRRLVATGFSRGGLGVLQIVSAKPNLLKAWAVVDPQPPAHQEEKTILGSLASGSAGWLRYGVFRNRDEAWKRFSSRLAEKLLEENRDNAELGHGEMALQAYGGCRLSEVRGKKSLYDFLELSFEMQAA